MKAEGNETAIRLSETERRALLLRYPQWQMVADRDAIRRYFRFADFAEAFGFVSAVAVAAEGMNHHPEWMNIFDRVEILLATHEVHGLSRRDVRLLERIDELALLFGAASG